jgi:hypothetical protein
MGRPRLYNTPAERTAAWRQRQRLATIGITTPAPTIDRELAAENTRLRNQLEQLTIELAAARATITRLTTTSTRPSTTRPPRPTPTPAQMPAPMQVTRPLPPPAPLPAPIGAPMLNRAQRRQAEREQRRHST